MEGFESDGVRKGRTLRIVLADGCFDPLHVGHLYHLQAAAKLGYLVVAVTADKFVNKGPRRPVFPQKQRVEMLKALRCVQRVLIVESGADAIRKVRPDIYVKGVEYRGRLPEARLVKRMGGRVVFTDTPVYSSTKLLSHLCK